MTDVSLGITSEEAAEAKRLIAGLPVTAVAQRSDWVKMLIYGVPGVGKTMLSGSSDEVERMRPVLFVDIEGGTKTIRDKYPDVEVLRVKDEFDEKGRLVKTSWERLQDVYEDIRKGVLPYKTYVIDSLTEGQKMSMYSVMTRTVKGDPTRDLDIPAQRDWGKSGEMVRRMVRAFRDLDANVIFTALEASDKDQQTGAVTITPSLPGKLRYEISAFLDEVLYMYTKVEKDGIIRRVLTQPTGKFIAKDRSGRLPQTMDDPSMAEIADLVLDPKEN
jgi:hypothetical protein